MKSLFPLKHLLIELLLASLAAGLFALFADGFWIWLVFFLVMLLIWHHRNEYSLLKLLDPNKTVKAKQPLEHLSQTVAFHNDRSKKEKFKTLRLLSKLNKNIQYLPDGIVLCDHDGNISWCNHIAQEILGFYWDKKAEKNLFSIVFYDEFKRYFRQPQHSRPLVLLTNEQKYLEINLNHYDSESLLMVVRDVTQFIRLLHARQTFLANMNHELRTPLTVLQGYLELFAADEHHSPTQQKAIAAMQAQSKRMADLLQQLNVLAKIETSNNAEHYVVDLSYLVLSLQKNAAMLNADNQHIQFDVVPEIKIKGDENQLQSAVSNLIYNAIKHAGKGADIHIILQKDEQGVLFEVCDNGVGIAPQHLPHLTERFYRVDESRSNQTGGSGLGLAIVKHALIQHDSILEIESIEGKGSCFRFRIAGDRVVSS